MDSSPGLLNKIIDSFGKPESTTQEDATNSSTSTTTQDTAAPALQSQTKSVDTAAQQDTVPPVEASKDIDTTVEKDVAPAVEHEKVKNVHKQEEETVIDRERHQHHYKTTVQPLKDREVLPTEHESEQAPTEHRQIDNDNNAGDVKAKVAADQAQFQNTKQEANVEKFQDKGSRVEGDVVHHHLHETVQPVIEKETVQPSVTHKTIPVKETINEASQDHGVETKEAISIDEFNSRLDGEKKVDGEIYDGAPKVT